jgi:hypothetical protein
MIFCHLASVVMISGFRIMLKMENKRRDRMSGNQEQPDLDETAFRDMTDRQNPNFRYVY